MRDLDLIRRLAREQLAARPQLAVVDSDEDLGPDAATDDPWSDDATWEARLGDLEEVGRWIRARRDALGRLRPTLAECHRLLASERGRRLAVDLAEELDLSAIYDEALEQPISLEEARLELRRHMIALSNAVPAASAVDVELPLAASSVAAAVCDERGRPLRDADALVWLTAIDARVVGATLYGLGHVRRSADGTATAALLVADPRGLADVVIDGLPIEAESKAPKAALLQAASYPEWPRLARGRHDVTVADATPRDAVALRALRAIEARQLDLAEALVEALAGGEGGDIGALADWLWAAIAGLRQGADD